MNNETMRLLAQFTIRARKVVGTVDIKQLSENSTYREELFKRVDELADEELIMTSLLLRAEFGDTMTENIQQVVPLQVTPESSSGKYVFGARG